MDDGFVVAVVMRSVVDVGWTLQAGVECGLLWGVSADCGGGWFVAIVPAAGIGRGAEAVDGADARLDVEAGAGGSGCQHLGKGLHTVIQARRHSLTAKNDHPRYWPRWPAITS